MAPVLLCPECGAKHPLDTVGRSAFPCKGCGRTLKVPQQVPAAAGARAAAPGADPDLPWPRAAAPDATSTRVLPTTTTPPPAPPPERVAPKRRAGPRDPVPGRAIRLALWIVAVPLGFVIVFALARVFGMLNSNQVEDVVITEGIRRFWPIARLLPFVALVTAGLVQAAVYGITSLRARRRAPRVPERLPQRGPA
ncbi:MAG: hypothetical protein QOG50_2525 [Actinomycetota bacterium]|nr:hypothetical protein [Actinomycetota bacterium]